MVLPKRFQKPPTKRCSMCGVKAPENLKLVRVQLTLTYIRLEYRCTHKMGNGQCGSRVLWIHHYSRLQKVLLVNGLMNWVEDAPTRYQRDKRKKALLEHGIHLGS